jgi:hypothetical protein
MEGRIYGLENEHGVTCTLRGQRRLSPDEVARYPESPRCTAGLERTRDTPTATPYPLPLDAPAPEPS